MLSNGNVYILQAAVVISYNLEDRMLCLCRVPLRKYCLWSLMTLYSLVPPCIQRSVSFPFLSALCLLFGFVWFWFCSRVSHWTWSLLIHLDWLASELQGSILLCWMLPEMELWTFAVMSGSHVCWGSALRSSCLLSENFTQNWAALRPFCLDTRSHYATLVGLKLTLQSKLEAVLCLWDCRCVPPCLDSSG